MAKRPARLALAATDVAAAAALTVSLGVIGAVRVLWRRRTTSAPSGSGKSPASEMAPGASGGRRMLTLEGDYSLATIRERGLEHIILTRDLDGFFEHVWSVNPLVGADPTEPAVGPPEMAAISPRHTVIQGKVNYSRRLTSFPLCNFIMGQASLINLLDRVVRTEQIDLVRASEPFYLGLCGLLLARSNHRPFVVRLIANYDSGYWAEGRPIFPRLFRRRWVEKRIDRFVLGHADLVAAGNQNIVEYALANHASPERTTVFLVGHLIDPVHFAERRDDVDGVRAEIGFGDRPLLICVSRLVEEKYPGDLLDVLAEARGEVPDLAAVLVGEGDIRAELEAKAAALGVAEDVFFAGNRHQEWVARAYASATVVISPLTGRVLVEAALSGTPIVAYDWDWQGEIVRPGQTGILVPPRDTKEMARAAVRLVKDPTLAKELGTNAREFVLELMDPINIMNHERQEYENLLKKAGR